MYPSATLAAIVQILQMVFPSALTDGEKKARSAKSAKRQEETLILSNRSTNKTLVRSSEGVIPLYLHFVVNDEYSNAVKFHNKTKKGLCAAGVVFVF
jgi:hypothetical protein